MGKELVLYRSRTGYTRCYAEKIAKVLNCDIRENRRLKIRDLEPYDTLIVGGGVYLGIIDGLAFILKNWTYLQDKKIYIFAVGLEQINSERAEQIWNRQLTREQRQKVSCHYVIGGLNYPKLKFLDKLVIQLFKFMMCTTKEGKRKTEWFIGNVLNPVDSSDMNSIDSLIHEVKVWKGKKKNT